MCIVRMQIVAFILSMTGIVMLLYRDPDVSPQIFNTFVVVASNITLTLFKVTLSIYMLIAFVYWLLYLAYRTEFILLYYAYQFF